MLMMALGRSFGIGGTAGQMKAYNLLYSPVVLRRVGGIVVGVWEMAKIVVVFQVLMDN